VAHVRFQPDGTPLPSEDPSRVVQKKILVDGEKIATTSRKRMKQMLDFVYAHTLPPVVVYPGGKDGTPEGGWGRFAMKCVWPKIIVPHATTLTREVESLLIDLGRVSF
jgi:hypothetical protein